MQSLKDLPQTGPPKSQRQSFCQIRKYVSYLPWICAKVKNSGTFIIKLAYLTVVQNFNLTGKEQNFQLKPFDIAVTLKCGKGHWRLYEKVKLNE